MKHNVPEQVHDGGLAGQAETPIATLSYLKFSELSLRGQMA